MTSDSQIVIADLIKIQCDDCGLIRSGAAIGGHSLEEQYVQKYQLAITGESAEPMIQTSQGPVARSEAISRWIMEGFSQTGRAPPRRVFEIGCSEGRVLEALRKVWPESSFAGVEPNLTAASQARDRGFDVREGGYQAAAGSYDLVFSVAVLEHVPSPSHFVSQLMSLLDHEGTLILMQPCQEDVSHDLLFVDHLHHFFLRHVRWLGEKHGLHVVCERLRNPLLPHFSMHTFSGRGPKISEFRAETDFAGRIAENVERWTGRFDQLENWLSATKGRNLFVWGVGEFFTLLRAYTRLGDEPIAGAFDHNLARYANIDYGFPIDLPPDELSLTDGRLLLTFRPNDALTQKVDAAHVPWLSPLMN
jgi:SAM-dependent methyltransferase